MQPNKITIKSLAKMKPFFEKEPFLTAAGVFFGFPECCIEDFVEGITDNFIQTPATGTGYMPCPCCAQEVHENWPQFQAKINANRFSTLPFPSETNEQELNKFFIDFTRMMGCDPKEKAQTLTDSGDILKLLAQESQKSERLARRYRI